MGILSRRLSTGERLSSAKDDPAGMSVSTRLRFQVDGTRMASQNTMNGISALQTAEAGLTEVHSILQRMRELAVQAANDTNTASDREQIQIEIIQLQQEIDSISQKTDYNRINLLNGHAGLKGFSDDVAVLSLSDHIRPGDYALTIDLVTGSVDCDVFDSPRVLSSVSYTDDTGQNFERVTIIDAKNRRMVLDLGPDIDTLSPQSINLNVIDNRLVFQTGANKDINVEVSIGEISAKSLGVDLVDVRTVERGTITVDGVTSTIEGAINAIKTLDAAISRTSEVRAKIGAFQNRFEMINNNLDTADIAIQTTLSKVFDTDMAFDMAELMRQRIVNQGALSVLGQANQRPQSVLQLIQ